MRKIKNLKREVGSLFLQVLKVLQYQNNTVKPTQGAAVPYNTGSHFLNSLMRFYQKPPTKKSYQEVALVLYCSSFIRISLPAGAIFWR